MSTTTPAADLYREHASHVWGLSYRMTGSSADADDIVQETFARAIEHPPPRTDEPWRPWLVRVAVNLARDRLRLRKRDGYVGTWLPSPIDTGALTSSTSSDATKSTPDARYEELESATFAFLLALEALGPTMRAVLLLRDVLDYSVAETASALSLTEGNVKTSHHRARRKMADYDAARVIPTAELQARSHETLVRFAVALAADDYEGLLAVLVESARSLNDGGGEFHAARVPVVGADRIARFFLGLKKKTPKGSWEPRMFNGLPSVVFHNPSADPKLAEHTVVQLEIGADGRIRMAYAVLASAKLRGLSL